MTRSTKFVIAEVGSVHDGSLGNALKLIEVAKLSGADVVKFQTHMPEFEVSPESLRPVHFRNEDRFDYFKRTGFTREDWFSLKRHADENEILFMSSAFSEEAVNLLDDLAVYAHKVPSGELTNIRLLERIADSKKPILLSSGMSNWEELDRAVVTLLKQVKASELTVLQCTSLYPCPPEKVGLNVIREIEARYGVNAGLSDHSFGPAAAIAAAASGAKVIEKHLTFSRLMYGSDAPYGMEPSEFADMCQGVKEVWRMTDNPVNKDDLAGLESARLTFQVVAVAARLIPTGKQIEESDIAYRKAGRGLDPSTVASMMGAKVKVSIKPNERILRENLHFE